jgi:GTP-binding protein YchF
MALSIGIVGLPNVGKSTLFQALTKKQVPAENYPFCTIEPNVGIVEVPDERLYKIDAISQSGKIIHTLIEFTDIAGLVKGASQGEGLGNKFLSHIRNVDAICEVVRSFEDKDITHVENRIDPLEDAEIIDLEIMLADLEQVQKAIPNFEKKSRGQDKEAQATLAILQKILTNLEQNIAIRDLELSEEEKLLTKSFNFLSQKPILYLVNTDDTYEIPSALLSNTSKKFLPISVKTESEIVLLEPAEQLEYLSMIGRSETGLDTLIQESYRLLDLLTFFTTGKDETRAWTTKKLSTAPQAAGVIHTDFEQGFIAAEVVSCDDFVTYNGEQGAKQAGKVRIEGKEYIMQDGDICHFRFNR